MAGHTYVTNGYSNYTDVPPQEGGYVYGPNQHVNWYMVETTKVERFRVPPNGYNNFDDGYNNFGGGPLKNERMKEYMPKYTPQGHHEINELNYGPENENASPPHYNERENLMDNFLNKLQIGASRPVKTSNLIGPNKDRPISPNKYRSKSPTYSYPSREPNFIKSQNLPAPNRYQPISMNNYQPESPTKYRPTSPSKYNTTSPNKYRPRSPTKYQNTSPRNYRQTSPTKYRPTSPTKYRPTSPTKYRPTSPTKYRPTSPTQYRSTSPTKYYPTSPTKYHLTSPTKYRPTSPTKYRPTSPTKFRPTSPTKYLPTSLNKYRQTSPTKYRPTSPTKYRPTSPTKFRPTSPTKYHPTSPTKYRPTSPTKYHPTSPTNFQQTNPTKYQPTSLTSNVPSKENHMVMPQNLRGPIKNQLTNPVHNVHRESQPTRTYNMSDPNSFHPSNLRSENNRIVTADEIPGQNTHLQRANPRVLTNPTNDINEALSFLAESVNNAPRAQPVKPEKRYGWNALGAANRRYKRADIIDSKEAIKKYNGAHVP